jgi:DNA-binding NtrC family response regulator
MEQGTFRPDLFYRLSVVVVDLPPLQARRGDIPLLTNHFAATCAQKHGRPVQEITPETMMVLKAYAWPGNVRELENAIEQAVLLSRGETITIGDLPQHIPASVSGGGGADLYDIPLREAREQFERHYLKEMLARAEGHVAEAARRAGIHRRHFYEKMKRYGISRA